MNIFNAQYIGETTEIIDGKECRVRTWREVVPLEEIQAKEEAKSLKLSRAPMKVSAIEDSELPPRLQRLKKLFNNT